MWIQSKVAIRDHPKIKRAARILGLSIPQMIGHLHLLWWWAMEYAQDGVISDYDDDDIAMAVLWDGDGEEFINALINCGTKNRCGLVDVTEDGDKVIHNWQQHCGERFKRQQKEAERLRNYRRESREKKKSRNAQSIGNSEECDTTEKTVHSTYAVRTQYDDSTNAVRTEYVHGERRGEERSREEQRGEERNREEKDILSSSEMTTRSEEAPEHSDDDQGALALSSKKVKDCPILEIIELYHETLPMLPRVEVVNDKRRKVLRTRWREDAARQNLEWWTGFFHSIKASDFLTGKVVGRDNKAFLPGIDWILNPSNFVKILEGNYANRGKNTAYVPPSRDPDEILADYFKNVTQKSNIIDIDAIETDRLKIKGG
jgi:hypothetical protein